MPEILQYQHRESALHSLHPLTKIAFLAVVLVVCVVSTNPVVLGGILLVILAAAPASRLSREILGHLPFLVGMGAILTLLTVLTIQSGEVLGYLIPAGVPLVPITTGGLHLGLVLSMRFIGMILAFQLVIVSTQPRDLVRALRILRLPADYALMVLIAIRFIPTIQMEATRIQEAQQSRGYDPGTGLFGRVRSIVPLVVPLVSNSLARATVLGLTIDMRGYRRSGPVVPFAAPFNRADRCVLGGILSGAAVFAAAIVFV